MRRGRQRGWWPHRRGAGWLFLLNRVRTTQTLVLCTFSAELGQKADCAGVVVGRRTCLVRFDVLERIVKDEIGIMKT